MARQEEKFYRAIMSIVVSLRLDQSVLVFCPDAEYKERIEKAVRIHFPGNTEGKLTIRIPGDRLKGEVFDCLRDEKPSNFFRFIDEETDLGNEENDNETD